MSKDTLTNYVMITTNYVQMISKHSEIIRYYVILTLVVS